MITRRTLALNALGAGLAAAGPALAQAPVPRRMPPSTFAGVTIGANSNTFASMSIDDAIAGMIDAGISSAELHPRQVQPQLTGLRLPPEGHRTSAQDELARWGRESMRNWRLNVPLETYAGIGRRYSESGITLRAHNQNYTDDFADDEIDRTFEMTKALGIDLISAVASNAMFRRLDVFARRHKVRVGMHNEVNIPDIAGFEAAAVGLSDYTGFTLDIGHFSATGSDPIAMMKKHGDRIFNMHIKDRVKNLGPTVRFGQGDTPIVQVLRYMRDNKFNPPANIEQEAPGADRLALARQALDYCRAALLS
jgi:sugar phosphate isomerase/epimerase